ncbi:MAG: hypothetical protein NT062_10385, partial [Proteobacteria bacterium]|nr:hypothetical protein [Pseudomonadota bacterium]
MKLSLEIAAEAAELADWAAAIAAIHAAWRAKRLPQLGALVALLDARQAALPIVGKTVAAREARWLELAQDPDEAVVPRLLATPWPIKPKDASARIAALAARAPSPRIAHALIALHARGQYASAAGRKLSRQIFRMLNAQQDPIVTAYLDDFEGTKRIIPLGVGYGIWHDMSPPSSIPGYDAFDSSGRVLYSTPDTTKMF